MHSYEKLVFSLLKNVSESFGPHRKQSSRHLDEDELELAAEGYRAVIFLRECTSIFCDCLNRKP